MSSGYNRPRARLLWLLPALLTCPAWATVGPFTPTVSLSSRYDDNLSRATKAADEREDLASTLRAAIGGSDSLSRDLLLGWEVSGEATHWSRYDAFDTAALQVRASLRHRFGLGAQAPFVRLGFAAGARITGAAGRDGWNAGTSVVFSHRPTDWLQHSVGADAEVLEARDEFHSTSARSLFTSLRFIPTESWAIGVGARLRRGDVHAFGTPPVPWRRNSPYLASIPVRQGTTFFGDPLNAWRLQATTWSLSADVTRELDADTSVTLGFEFADSRRDGLTYINRLTFLSVSRRF